MRSPTSRATHTRRTGTATDLGGALRGFVHAHVGWLFTNLGMEQGRAYGKDLYEDRLVRWIDRLYLVWVVLTLGIPFAVGYSIGGTWERGVEAMVWGGLLRIFLYQHATFAVNSICHMFGRQDFRSRDEARNNWIVALLVFGEGWHNNHHAFPASARHGLLRGQFDVSWWVIHGLETARARLGRAHAGRAATRAAPAAGSRLTVGKRSPRPIASLGRRPRRGTLDSTGSPEGHLPASSRARQPSGRRNDRTRDRPRQPARSARADGADRRQGAAPPAPRCGAVAPPLPGRALDGDDRRGGTCSRRSHGARRVGPRGGTRDPGRARRNASRAARAHRQRCPGFD